MSRKRRNTSSAEPEDTPSRKRPSYDYDGPDDCSDSYEQPQLNASTGLTNAFPGLINDAGLFYGPAHNGLDYLRMVRSEAHGIPQLLTAPDVRFEGHEQNQEGFFGADEAFIAAPILEKSEESYSSAQAACYETIIMQFDRLRTRMKITPSLSTIQSLPSTLLISFPESSKTARKQWEEYVINNTPNPIQVSCMNVESVLQLLKLITKRMHVFIQPYHDEETRIKRVGAWVWALLARCPDSGELSSEEISDIRACAKAADRTWHCLQEQGPLNHSDGLSEDSSSDEHASGNSHKQTQIRGDLTQTSDHRHGLQPSALDHTEERRVLSDSVRRNQQVLLDMIITVVGEAYGQRDLLALRRPWSSGKPC